jgi:hypothetical protein
MRKQILSLLVSLFVAGAAHYPAGAQTIGFADAIDRLAKACGADIQKYCSKVNLGAGRIRHCLNQNQSKVSAQCRTAVPEVFALLEKRATAQASVLKICDRDIRRVCPGIVSGDGNLLECGLKAERALSAPCNQAITDAGWR